MNITNLLVHPAQPLNVTDACKRHVMKVFEHFFWGSPWAVDMLDSISKIPESLMDGNIIDYGNYDQCLNIKVNEDWGSFTGRYCMTLIFLTIDNIRYITDAPIAPGQLIPVGFSLCMPSTCSPGELQYTLSKIHNGIHVDETLCSTKNEEVPFETVDWITIFIFGILALLSLIGTSYHLIVGDEERCPKSALLFSWYYNGKKLFSTKSVPGSMEALHGIRFLTIFWIELGHSMVFTKWPAVNLISHMESQRSLFHLVFGNAVYGVDTFFVISGMLLTYNFLKHMHSKKKFRLHLFYLHRYLRITPVLAIVILIHITIVPKVVGYGPFWNFMTLKDNRGPCLKTWWSTLLYIHNYMNNDIEKMCVTVSWYLAVDMQLFWISPALLFLLYKKPKAGLIIATLGCLIAVAISFQGSYSNKSNPNIVQIGSNLPTTDFFTHYRYLPWLLGVIFGYIIYETSDWRSKALVGAVKLPKLYVACGWIVGMGCLFTTVVSIYPFSQKDYELDVLGAALFLSLRPILWATGVMWLIFACISGYGGIVNSILSWKFFHPLSRLSFCIYLLHIEFAVTHISTLVVPSYYSDENEAARVTSDMVLTVLASIVMSLTVEAPFIQLEKIIFDRGPRRKTSLRITSGTAHQMDAETKGKQVCAEKTGIKTS